MSPDCSRFVSLRALGLSLEEIQDCLDHNSLLDVMERHLGRLREQLTQQERLYRRLDGVAQLLRRGEEVTLEALLRSIEETTMHEKYFTKEQARRDQGPRRGVRQARARRGQPRLAAANQ